MEHQDTLRALLDAIQETALLIDPEGVIVAINRVGADRLGYHPNDIVGTNAFELLPPDVAQTRMALMEDVLKQKETIQFVDHRDGMYFETTGAPVVNEAGEVCLIAIYARNISENKERESRLTDSEARLEKAQEMAGMGHWAWDIADNTMTWSNSMYRLLHVNPEGLGISFEAFLSLAPPRDRETLKAALAEALFEEKGFEMEHGIIRPDGREIQVHTQVEIQFDWSGEATRVLGITQDITERKMAERELRIKESAIQSSINAIVLVDLYGMITYVNQAFIRMWKIDSSRLNSGDHFTGYFRNPPFVRGVIQKTLQMGKWFGELEAISKVGEPFFVQLSCNLVLDEDSRPICLMASLVDITRKKRVEEQLIRQAKEDALTGLFNRRHFMTLLETQVGIARRHGIPLSVCMLDLDHFKSINDTYGHKSGDDVLSGLGRLLARELRREDIAGRYGGEEFVLVIPHTTAKDALTVVERIRQEIENIEFTSPNGETFKVTASFGLSEFSDDASTEKDILQQADQALYQAKSTGRNKVVVYRSIRFS